MAAMLISVVPGPALYAEEPAQNQEAEPKNEQKDAGSNQEKQQENIGGSEEQQQEDAGSTGDSEETEETEEENGGQKDSGKESEENLPSAPESSDEQKAPSDEEKEQREAVLPDESGTQGMQNEPSANEAQTPAEESGADQPEEETSQKSVDQSVTSGTTGEASPELAEPAAYGLTAPVKAADDVSSTGLVFGSAGALPTEPTTYRAGEGEIVWTPSVEDGKAVSGSLLLKNVTISGCSMGIQMPVPVEIVLEGENRIEAESYGIYMSNTYNIPAGGPLDVTLRGSGSLEIDSKGIGINTNDVITVDQVGTLSITYGSSGQAGSHGLYVTQAGGSITIQDCGNVKIKSSDSVGPRSSAAGLQNTGDVTIKNSHVLLTCGQGPAIGAVSGAVEFLDSDVRAVGNTSSEYASGTLSYGHLSMAGGTLYAENTGSDDGLPFVSGRTDLSQDTVIYFKKIRKVPRIQGDGIWYVNCVYDEAADTITVGNGYVMGNVSWNENILFSAGRSLFTGRYDNSTLRIPEGMSVDIPPGSSISNGRSGNYTGTFINQGVLNVLDGGTIENYYFGGVFINEGVLNIQQGGKLYNTYSESEQQGGTIQNKGNIQVSAGAVFQNQSRLENSGTIDTAGDFSIIRTTGYSGVLENTGTVNGFAVEMLDNSYTNIAYGDAALSSGQMLTVGQGVAGSGTKGRTLQIPEGAKLTIEAGAVVDAQANVTAATLSQYLQLEGELVVEGTLLLPENVSGEALQELAEHISGTGKVQVGTAAESVYYVAVVAEGGDGASGRGLYQRGTTVTVAAGAREGCRFRGWSASEGVVLADPASAQTTFVMPERSVTLTAGWEVLVSSVTLDADSLSLQPGETALLHAVISPADALDQSVVWTSDHPEVAQVDQSGRVTAVAPGTAVITVTSSEGGKTAQCTVTVKETTEEPTPPDDPEKPAPSDDPEKPTPPVDTEGPQFRLVFEQGMKEIPQTLLEKGLNTSEKIAFVMKLEILKTQTSIPQENMALYDVTLLVRRPGSSQWEKADASNFPANGKLQVVLPYPQGTGRDTHDFLAAHMFTTDDFGKTPGEIETPEVTKTDEGLRLEVTGLSPILLTWSEIQEPEAPGRPARRSHRSGHSSDSSAEPAAAAEAAAQWLQSAETGDDTHLGLWWMLLLLACAGLGWGFEKRSWFPD